MYDETRFGSPAPFRYPLSVQFAAFMIVMVGSFGLYYFFENKKMFRPVLPQQFPGAGKVHYTFEPKS